MKVAVIYSGLIPDESYKDNIWHMKTLLPDADFYYTTWKGRGEWDFIDHYFDEPFIKYNCENHIHKDMIRKFREIQNEGGDYRESPKFQKFEWLIKHEGRSLGRNRVKQHLIHALAVEKFCEGKDYDIIIRIRYDLNVKKLTKDFIDFSIDLCYNEKKPVAFGAVVVDPPETLCEIGDMKALPDFIIIHREDMFAPDLVKSLIKCKKMEGAEGGWYNVMCRPYNVNYYAAYDMVNMT